MSTRGSVIDIKESALHRTGALLDILLLDRTTNKNIIWATDSYIKYGEGFAPVDNITPELVTGDYHTLIQPRAAKSLEEQRYRTKEKAEVFTPLSIVKMMNDTLETTKPNKDTWQTYVRENRLEITCGEAPFIVSRYDPTAKDVLIPISKRVGFLDRKLRVVSRYCEKKADWLFWAMEAFKASYGYEWQGDNVLLARENLLYTFIDYYEARFGKKPSVKLQEEFAEVISWNIFQMDGLRYVIPMSQSQEYESDPQPALFSGLEEARTMKIKNSDDAYVQIMDWQQGKTIRFVDLIK